MAEVGRFLDRCIAYLSRFGIGMGVLATIVLMSMISLNVFLRYFLNRPMIHTFELSAYLFIIVPYLGNFVKLSWQPTRH